MSLFLLNLGRVWQQSSFIPTPALTEKNLPDQSGRVAIITGGYAGVGYQLSKIIYQRNGIVYVAGRSEQKGKDAIASIKKAVPNSKGRLEFLNVDLSHLPTVKPAADDFMRREQRLDVLTNNAGVMGTSTHSRTPEGHEIQMSTNCLGPYLLTKLLLPLLQETALISPPGSVRVTWAGSLAIDVQSPPGGGVNMTRSLEGDWEVQVHEKERTTNYGMTKVGNLFLASQHSVRYPENGVQHLAFNPGNLRTDLGRHFCAVPRWIVNATLVYEPVYGAYTELFAGWADEAGRKDMNGAYITPWGRFSDVRPDIQKEVEDGKKGKGKAVAFWEWCERETQAFG